MSNLYKGLDLVHENRPSIEDEFYFTLDSLDIWNEEQELVFDIFTAASLGNWHCLQNILCKDKSIINTQNYAGWTALMYAGYFGHDNVVQELLNVGASAHSFNNKGETTLMLAATCGNDRIIIKLLEAGSNLEFEDNSNWTALYHAVYWNQVNTVRKLLERQSNPNIVDSVTGKTPLMRAAELGSIVLVQDLIYHHANPFITCKEQHNALWYAEQSQSQLVILLLSSLTKENMYDIQPRNIQMKNDNSYKIDSNILINNDSVRNEWKAPDVCSFLHQLDLSSYLPMFEEQAIDLPIFLTMTDEDLKEIGIIKMGPRRKITSAIDRWHKKVPLNNVEGAYADRLNTEIQQLRNKLELCKEDCKHAKCKASQEQDLRVHTEGSIVEARRRLQLCHSLSVQLNNQFELFKHSLISSTSQANNIVIDKLINIQTCLKELFDLTNSKSA